ncbi:hypothetical protein D3C78_770270 [compost metagenome]
MHTNAQRAGIFHGPNRNLPHQFSAFQIDGGHSAERRLLAGNTQRREETLAHGTKRRAVHWHNSHLNAAGVFGDVCTRHHIVCQSQTHIIDEHQAVIRIHRHAAPVHAAERARELQRTVKAWRSKDALMTHLFKLNTAQQQIDRRRPPHVGFGQRLVANHRHTDGIRLRRRIAFALDRARRDRTFLDFRYRLTGFAVEHKNHALFAGLHQNRGRAAFTVRQIVQQRLRRQVKVPQVVVSGLIMPAHLTGRCINGHNG